MKLCTNGETNYQATCPIHETFFPRWKSRLLPAGRMPLRLYLATSSSSLNMRWRWRGWEDYSMNDSFENELYWVGLREDEESSLS
mmetsp:Transcript_14283/g.39690  ORF Transcript_14283/g.39690 Transcript_14283/m.39690 type:complete len:85 (-) Transcript_14283:12-266(-)